MQSVPAAIERGAERYRLGQLEGVYAFRRQVPLGYVLGPLAMLIGCVILGLTALLYMNVLPNGWVWLMNVMGVLNEVGLGNLAGWQVVLIVLVGLAWLLVGGWMVVAARMVRNMRVFVYERGLIVRRVRMTVVLWQQVVSLWKDVQEVEGEGAGQGLKDVQEVENGGMRTGKSVRGVEGEGRVRAGRNVQRVEGKERGQGLKDVQGVGDKVRGDGKKRGKHVYTVQCADDTLVRFDDELVDIEKLGSLLEDTVTRRLLPGVLATYEAGSAVEFAEVVVSTRGVGMKRARQLLPWRDVAGITIDDSALTLYHFQRNGIWATLPVASIPNVGVLKALLGYVMRDLSHLRLPGVLATYESGLALDFGALRVSKRGVEVLRAGGSDGNVQLPWDEVASIAVGEHEVMMRRRGSPSDWYALPIAGVYDAPLLKALLEHLMHKG